jgi:hypothetical protein
MIDTLTAQQLREVVAQMKAHAVPPRIVCSEDEAYLMTADDPTGHIWYVGEEYYAIPIAE